MRTIVYVDGFNLYYGAVKDTAYKWLDIGKMCGLLLPQNEIVGIKYFTARVSARPDDPGQPTRQQMFLRALGTIPGLEIIFGHFLSNETVLPRADSPPENRRYARVIKTEEKGSDVNLATHFLCDAFRGRFECGVLVTNDSDLREPVRVVRRELHRCVGVVNPHRRPSSKELTEHASFQKTIRTGVLAASQFPDELEDANGRFTRPAEWVPQVDMGSAGHAPL